MSSCDCEQALLGKDLLCEAIYLLKNNHAHHDDYDVICDDSDCGGCLFHARIIKKHGWVGLEIEDER